VASGVVESPARPRDACAVATILGTARDAQGGDALVAGRGRGQSVRSMNDFKGSEVDEAQCPACRSGARASKAFPDAGEVSCERRGDLSAIARQQAAREARRIALQAEEWLSPAASCGSRSRTRLHRAMPMVRRQVCLPLSVKSDVVPASLEALEGRVSRDSRSPEIKVRRHHDGRGRPNESDGCSRPRRCVIIGFNVRPVGRHVDVAQTRED